MTQSMITCQDLDYFLYHGCNLDDLTSILMDEVIHENYNTDSGDNGVSLSRSLMVAKAHGEADETGFKESFYDYYGLDNTFEHQSFGGAVMVFQKSMLETMPFDWHGDGREEEERVMEAVPTNKIVSIYLNQDGLKNYISEVERATLEAESSDEVRNAYGQAWERVKDFLLTSPLIKPYPTNLFSYLPSP